MPAKKKKGQNEPNLAVRQIRNACRMTQDEFAKFVGFSSKYIQAVEQGEHPPTPELVGRIESKTGAVGFGILKTPPEAVDMKCQPYTSESFRAYSELARREGEIYAEQMTKMASLFIEGRMLIEESNQEERKRWILKNKNLAEDMVSKMDELIAMLNKVAGRA